jgi:hypothetical protein
MRILDLKWRRTFFYLALVHSEREERDRGRGEGKKRAS